MYKRKQKKRNIKKKSKKNPYIEKINLHPETKKSLWIVTFIGIAIILILAGINQAGPFGKWIYSLLENLFGIGYYLLPLVSLMLGLSFLSPDQREILGLPLIGGIIFMLSGLGFIDIIYPGGGGIVGLLTGYIKIPFGVFASIVIELIVLLSSVIIILNKPLKISLDFLKRKKDNEMYYENYEEKETY